MNLDENACIAASVKADDQPLLPAASFAGPLQAMTYVEAALVDVRWGDHLEAVVRAPELRDRIFQAASREVLLAWLGPTLLEAWRRGLALGSGANSPPRRAAP